MKQDFKPAPVFFAMAMPRKFLIMVMIGNLQSLLREPLALRVGFRTTLAPNVEKTDQFCCQPRDTITGIFTPSPRLLVHQTEHLLSNASDAVRQQMANYMHLGMTISMTIPSPIQPARKWEAMLKNVQDAEIPKLVLPIP